MRRDRSLFTKWWWTVDRWIFSSLAVLIVCGVLASFAASPSVAIKLGLSPLFFAKRHVAMLALSFFVMFIVSFLSPRQIRYFSVFFYGVCLVLLVTTLFIGAEIKGARRWISLGGFSLQTSEFVKPFFAVLSAWALSSRKIFISFLLLLFPVCLFIMQPDLGMTIVTVLIWVGQLFIMGLPFIVFGGLIALGVGGFLCAYLFLPHVTTRVHQFTQGSDPTGDMFQVFQSLRAFKQGGFWGKGPGEGIVKYNIPDVHADFVFSVIGEEFGFFVCFLILSIFLFIMIHSLFKISNSSNLFSILAISGIVIQFGLQTFINIASSVHMIPTKGMTLPFLSYGGSSSIALGIGMGMLLSLTRKRHGVVDDV